LVSLKSNPTIPPKTKKAPININAIAVPLSIASKGPITKGVNSPDILVQIAHHENPIAFIYVS